MKKLKSGRIMFCPALSLFSVMRRYRTNVSYLVTESVSLRTELTDVTLVSEDTYSDETLDD